ncbi:MULTISPECIES: phosphate signaling complex protein PhoU [unclassified Nesterenkonia]|uniref:phosphate signaling complex protein PhoU n=1 Tax=unclassified Nesterenkonia TaxID=2629769 RepID=UPI000871C18E|nr:MULTISPECIES: phosphate signaling complex protein PhoU [unclassified Nesterenkonia]MDS2173770.1 phosphate signaling complex protein PhoU [Nesterenkonia sp. CL21]OSM44328.1 phosphate transport system regulatory protein PhoU [Nesterenkonia sp. PF2B19]
MRKLFQEDLQNLGEQLIDIATLVSQAMQKAYRSFETADVQLAEEVIAADQRIDALQNDLDERAIDLLALQGPVASDLRTIVGALRMSTSLERMGDLARHIGQLVRLRYPDHVSPEHLKPVYARMAQHAQDLAEKVVRLLQTRDLALVDEITAENEAINALHASVFRLIAEDEWDASPATTADCTLASRYFERFGDHGVSVAKKVAYLVTGEWDVKAHAE